MVAIETAGDDAIEFGVRVAQRVKEPQAENKDRRGGKDRHEIGA
jgi:hypothetical protein